MGKNILDIYADIHLAKELETAIAESHVLFTETHAQLYPQKKACAINVGGGYAAYAGADSPITQAIAVGLQGKVASKELERLQEFYWQRNVVCAIEHCPLADDSVLSWLNEQQYRLVEYSNILYFPLTKDQRWNIESNEFIIAPTDECQTWCDTTLCGFIESGDAPSALSECFATYAHMPQVTCFLVKRDGISIGGGEIGIYGGVCDLGLASTLPQWRGHGVQKALLAQRLAYAVAQGCHLATVTTEPGSISQINCEKMGFKIAYTRTKFEKSPS